MNTDYVVEAYAAGCLIEISSSVSLPRLLHRKALPLQ